MENLELRLYLFAVVFSILEGFILPCAAFSLVTVQTFTGSNINDFIIHGEKAALYRFMNTLNEYQTIPTKMTAAQNSDNGLNMGVYEKIVFLSLEKTQYSAKM